MNNTSSGMREKVLKVLIMLAACFAIGSVGFFIAVLLQHAPAASNTVDTIQPVQAPVSTSTKETIVENLNGPSDGSASSSASSTSAALGSTTDAQTSAKLKILQGLNTK